MAGLTGLFQRGTRYYLRVVLPLQHPLRNKYKNGEFVASLGCSSYRDALLLGTVRRAEVLQGGTGMVGGHPPTWMGVIAATHSDTLLTVHSSWKSSKTRSTDSVNACLRAVRQYEEFRGDLHLSKMTRTDGEQFVQWLVHPDRKTTSKTARDRLTWVKSLLQYATVDLELLPKNPWTGLDIDFKTTSKRRPWTADELQKLFDQPLHAAHSLPRDRKAGKEAAYWIPLLGLYTGARVSELAQLRVEDIKTIHGWAVMAITDEGQGQKVKTSAGVRDVPIHSELIRLGFLDYVENLRRIKEDLLWPHLPAREGKPGGYFSHWFGEYRRSLGFGKNPDFHCFRHTVRTQLAEGGIAEPLIDALIGHEGKGSIGAKIYTHRSIKLLASAVESMSHPYLKLPNLAVITSQ